MVALKGSIKVPGDKSVSHRALIFSAFSKGKSRVLNCSPAQDVRSTAECLSGLGLKARVHEDNSVDIESQGINELTEPNNVLFAGNSGTTIRLLSGLVAGRPFTTSLDGDESLRRRTMKRIFEPLTQMGAEVEARDATYAPFAIKGGALNGRSFELKVASAQVEACILLAGLQAEGRTSVTAPYTVRDHTRRMFAYLGIPFAADNGTLSVERLEKPVPPFELTVPSDISSAAFFMVAAACLPGSDLTLEGVGMNPGRTLIIDALKEMGAAIDIITEAEVSGEPVADVRVRYRSPLHGINIGEDRIASGIDEIPVLAIAGSLCDGQFVVSGAEELRHKESDRIKTLCDNLKAAGVNVVEHRDGFAIDGARQIPGGSPWQAQADHRLAMTGLIASLVFEAAVDIDDLECIAVSYPGFAQDLNSMLA